MERSNFIEVEKAISSINNAWEEQKAILPTIITMYNNLGTASKNAMPSGLLKSWKETEELSAKQAASLKRIADVQSRLNREEATAYIAQQKKVNLSKAELQYSQQRERITKREQAELEKLNNEYNKIEIRLKQLQSEYNNLATIKARGNQLSVQEEQRLMRLTTLTNGYNNVLKKVDADMGKYSRNVGNYASQWDGLQFQTNQIIREVPSMAYGANVFFGAISNNLPMFIDEVKNARDEQKALLADGKQAPSVVSRVVSSIFNWQTALIGLLTYLTLNGKEVWNWVQSLWGASAALEEITKRQTEFSKARLEGKKNAQSEIIELRKNLAVVSDSTRSNDQRNEALKQLRQTYYYYFKDLSDAQILEGKYTSQVDKLNIALEKRKEVEIKTELNTQNRQRLVELNAELDIQQNLIKTAQSNIKNSVKREYSARTLAFYSDNLRKAEKERNKIQEEINVVYKDTIKNETDIFNLRKDTIELDIQEEKNKNKATTATYNYISAKESEYRLLIKYRESSINDAQKIFESESKTYSERSEAMKEMYRQQTNLSKDVREEELRLNKLNFDEEISLLEKANKQGILKTGEYAQQKNEIIEKYANEEAIIWKTHNDKVQETDEERAKGLDILIRRMWQYLKLTNKISSDRLEKNSVALEKLSGLKFGEATKGLEEFINTMSGYDSSDNLDKLGLDLANINQKIADATSKGVKEESNEYQNLLKERLDIEKQIQDEQAKTTRKAIDELVKLEASYKSFMDGFTNEITSGFSQLTKIISDEFQEMISGLLKNGETERAMMAVAIQISEVFQEMYNFMDTYSDEYYQRQYDRLEAQKETSIKFAGDNAVAREEIERQYEEKRKRIEREQARRQRDLAAFNIIMNTAQGVTSALANGNIALSIIIGLMGLAQLAKVRSQPLPAFAEGGVHSGGAMLVNDGKGSKYQEKVVTPDGKVHSPKGRNVVMNAPNGTRIFTHDQWNSQMSNILMSNNIMPMVQDRGITKEDLQELMNHNNGYNGVEINVDKQGFQTMITRNGQRINSLNNRIQIKNVKR